MRVFTAGADSVRTGSGGRLPAPASDSRTRAAGRRAPTPDPLTGRGHRGNPAHCPGELVERQCLPAVAQRARRLAVHLDEEGRRPCLRRPRTPSPAPSRPRRFRGSGPRSRAVRVAFQHRHGPRSERVAGGRLEGADASLAEDHLAVPVLHDVFAASRYSAAWRSSALEQHGAPAPADLLEQREVLHVARSDLQDVGARHHVIEDRRPYLGDDREPGSRPARGPAASARLSSVPESCRATCGLVGAAPQHRAPAAFTPAPPTAADLSSSTAHGPAATTTAGPPNSTPPARTTVRRPRLPARERRHQRVDAHRRPPVGSTAMASISTSSPPGTAVPGCPCCRQARPAERSCAPEAWSSAGAVVVAAGPCAVEDEDQLLSAARAVKAAGARVLRGGAYKPRTSPYSFQDGRQTG